jgi:hypothetical protein
MQEGEFEMDRLQDLIARYVALWNEPVAATRAAEIRALWAPEGQHFYRDQIVTGYRALEERVAGSVAKNVVSANNRFRDRKDARQTHNGVAFTWEMVPAGGAEVLAVGLQVLLLDPAGRIAADYQFILA